DPVVASDADRAPGARLAAAATLPSNGVKARVHQQDETGDGVVVHDDGAARHQAGAIDFHAVPDVDSRVRAEGEQRGMAGRSPDLHVSTEADAAAAPDAQPPGAGEARPEGVAAIAQAQVEGAEAHVGGGSAREGS